MTQASNVGILTPKINSSGQLDATTGLTGAVPVANGGTGAATYTANNVLLGNGTSAFQTVAPGTNGNVLTSNGTTWTSSAPAGGGGLNGMTTFTSSGTFTVPAGVTKILVELCGAGGGARGWTPSVGAAGGYSKGVITVTPGASITATVGTGVANGTGGTTSFSTITATGGSCSISGGTGGTGSGGSRNITGGTGLLSTSYYGGSGGAVGGANGGYFIYGDAHMPVSVSGLLGGSAGWAYYNQYDGSNWSSPTPTGPGNGACVNSGSGSSSIAGANGIIILIY